LQPLLFDEGLPKVAPALAALGLAAHEVGDPGAPPKQSSDEVNCQWCKENGAVLVTHDRGKGSKQILQSITAHGVGVIVVHKDLRSAPAHCLARALLVAEGKMDALAGGRHAINHRLGFGGSLKKR
jgi:Domain of unknown function (DUF5615)